MLTMLLDPYIPSSLIIKSTSIRNNAMAMSRVIWLCALLIFVPSLVTAASGSCGLTIITHGLQPPSYPIWPLSSGDKFPAWVRTMAEAVTNRIGGNVPIYRVWFDPNTHQVSLLDGETMIDVTKSGGAVIMLDWSDVSWNPRWFSAQEIGESFAAYLFDNFTRKIACRIAHSSNWA